MDAEQLISTITASGGKLWAIDGQLYYRGPSKTIDPLLATLKANKQAVLALINASTPVKRALVYKITVDGNQITAIDTTNKSLAEFSDGTYKRFGANRVSEIKRVIH